MPYRINETADTDGTYARAHLPLTRETMCRAFGRPTDNGYFDEEAGYVGDEWYFEEYRFERADAVEDAAEVKVCDVYNVYFRWGNCHVGSSADKEAVDRFVHWLTDAVR